MVIHKQIIVSEFVWKQLMTWKIERNLKSVDALLLTLIKEEEKDNENTRTATY